MLTWHEDEPPEKITAPVTHELKPMLKSEALAPETVGVFVTVTLEAVPFVNVAVMGDAKPPSAVDGKTTGLGANATPVLPVPVRFAVIGLGKPVGPVYAI